MNRKTFLGVMAVALVTALAAGSLIASNMGFKLNYALNQGDGGVTSKSGTNTLALPDNRQSGLNTAKNLMDDIGFAQTANVKRWLEASDLLQTYTGRKGSPGADFPLAAGEGYFVTMNTTVNYIVVGSDDPALAYNLNQGDGGVTSKSGTNFYAYNYHQTAATAKALMDDIGFAQTANVKRWLKASDLLQTYTGRKGSPGADFSLVPGEAYFVTMNTTVNYVPSHY
jgi:hypothetical protein